LTRVTWSILGQWGALPRDQVYILGSWPYIQGLMRACAMLPPVGQVYNYAIPAAAGCLLGCTAARRVSVLPQFFSFFPSKSRLDIDLTVRSWKLFYTLLLWLSTLLLRMRKVLMKFVSKLLSSQSVNNIEAWLLEGAVVSFIKPRWPLKMTDSSGLKTTNGTFLSSYHTGSVHNIIYW